MLSVAKINKCWQLLNLEMKHRQLPNLATVTNNKVTKHGNNCRLAKLANFTDTKVAKLDFKYTV